VSALLIVEILIFVVGVPFTLWWWRHADRWADAEQKRFKSKPPPEPIEKIVIPSSGSAGEGTSRPSGSGGSSDGGPTRA
jgi:hypothetical protein